MTDQAMAVGAKGSEAVGHAPARLLEELPIFCETCGYSLNALPQVRCEHCSVLQFHCPECGHHQPINTLRPAVQRVMARARAWVLALIVFAKLNYFGWCLFGWLVVGWEFSYSWNYQRGTSNVVAYQWGLDDLVGLGIFALAFAMIGRMLALRWRNGSLVGLVIGLLLAVAMMAGALWRQSGFESSVSPWNSGFLYLVLVTALCAAAGAALAWWVWRAFVYLFLPRKAAGALLDWQRSLSTPRATSLARE